MRTFASILLLQQQIPSNINGNLSADENEGVHLHHHPMPGGLQAIKSESAVSEILINFSFLLAAAQTSNLNEAGLFTF